MIKGKHVRVEGKHVGICISVYKLNEFIEFVKQKSKPKRNRLKPMQLMIMKNKRN